MSEGVYRSERHRTGRRRKIVGIVTGVVVALGAGSYAATTWLVGRDATVTGETGALAPVITDAPTPPPYPSTVPESALEAPAPGTGPATKSAARQSSRPSPMPSPSPMTDEELADRQVSRLLQPRPSGSGVAAAGERLTVRNEVTPDGANVRLVSARFDLGARHLWAADLGRPFGATRCTQNFRTDDQALGQVRPGLLLCWRTSAGKSVVAVATGRPRQEFVAAVVEREWAGMG